jgi:hypothetical protein
LDAAGVDLIELSGGTYATDLGQAFSHKSERTRKREAYCTSLLCLVPFSPCSLLTPAVSLSPSSLGGTPRCPAVVEFAENVKPVIKNALLATTGGFRSRSAMEEALQGGATDFCGLARPLTAEPHLIRDILAGKTDRAKENKVVSRLLSCAVLPSNHRCPSKYRVVRSVVC